MPHSLNLACTYGKLISVGFSIFSTAQLTSPNGTHETTGESFLYDYVENEMIWHFYTLGLKGQEVLIQAHLRTYNKDLQLLLPMNRGGAMASPKMHTDSFSTRGRCPTDPTIVTVLSGSRLY